MESKGIVFAGNNVSNEEENLLKQAGYFVKRIEKIQSVENISQTKDSVEALELLKDIILSCEVLFQTTDDYDEESILHELSQARTETERRNSELKALLDSVPVGVLITRDPEGLQIIANKTAHEILQVPLSEDNVSKLTPKNERMHSYRIFKDGVEVPLQELPVKRAAEGHETKGVIYDLVFDDGNIRHVIINATTLYNEDRTPRGAIATFDDLTDFMRDQNERAARSRLLDIINQSVGTAQIVGSSLEFFYQIADCEATGICFTECCDYSTCNVQQLSDNIFQRDSLVYTCDPDNAIAHSAMKNAFIKYLYTAVTSGNMDGSEQFFTSDGSFWTNSVDDFITTMDTSEELATISDSWDTTDFGSIALIPLHTGMESLGLLLFYDSHKGSYRLEDIELWERLANKLAIALAKNRAEEALQKSQLEMIGIIENLDGGFMTLDTSWRFTRINSRAAHNVGYKPEDLIGEIIWERFPEVIDTDLGKCYRKVMIERVTTCFEDFGKITGHWYSHEVYPSPEGIAIFWYDITKRKNAEMELERQKDVLTTAAENTKAHLVYFDQDFNFIWVNQAYATACAKKQEDFVGHNHFEFYPNEENEAIFRQVRDTGIPFEIKEKPFIFPDHPEWGTTYWDWTLTPIKDTEGNVTNLVFSLMDVTHDIIARLEIKRLQAEAEHYAAELESFFSSMSDGVVLHDAKGSPILANKAAKEILESSPQGSIEHRVAEYCVCYLDGRPMVPEETASGRALRGEIVRDMRYMVTAPHGLNKVISVSSSPVRATDGTVLGTTTVFRDITDLVEIEQQKEELFRREHHIAEILQQAILPPNIPTEILGSRFAVEYRPASEEAEIGGDFYDVFDLGDNKIAVLIGDVTGKGLPAAIRVASARHAIRSYAYLNSEPGNVLALANDSLCKDSFDESGILTVFYAVIDHDAGKIVYSSAGHEPPVMIHACGCYEELITGGLPLGFLPSASFEQLSCKLEAGDILVMVTDGITEARAEGSIFFGKEGLIDFVLRNYDAPLDYIASGLLDAATAHAGGRLQDDAAVVILEPELGMK